MKYSRPMLSFGLLLGPSACASSNPALLSVPVEVTAAVAAFSPVAGVEVTLSEARVTLADLRLEAPAAVTTRGGSFGLAAWISTAVVPAAWAHPGHDFSGSVAGELTGTWTLDLLSQTTLGNAACYEGDYATARLQILPEPAVVLAGEANIQSLVRPFRFEVMPDQALTGLDFVATLKSAAPPSRISLEVDLAHALSYLDWSTPDTDGDGQLTTADGDGTLATTVLFGVVSSPTWRLSAPR